MHVFIDTNIYLKFFHFANDELAALDKVFQSHQFGPVNLYLTEQVRDEYSRNREVKLHDALEHVKKLNVSQALPSFMKGFQEAADFQQLCGSLTNSKKALLKKVQGSAADRQLDADQLISRIFSDSELIETTPAIYEAATMRSHLGNPPGKQGSIGDAINWLHLIEHIPHGSDIHVVSADGDFYSKIDKEAPMPFLVDEWSKLQDGKVFVYRTLTSLIKQRFGGLDNFSLTDDLYGMGYWMVDSDETICGLIAESNACGYGPDDVKVLAKSMADENTCSFTAHMQFTADGPRSHDAPWCGNQITTQLSGIYLQDSEGNWNIEEYLLESARLNSDRYEHDEYDEEAFGL